MNAMHSKKFKNVSKKNSTTKPSPCLQFPSIFVCTVGAFRDHVRPRTTTNQQHNSLSARLGTIIVSKMTSEKELNAVDHRLKSISPLPQAPRLSLTSITLPVTPPTTILVRFNPSYTESQVSDRTSIVLWTARWLESLVSIIISLPLDLPSLFTSLQASVVKSKPWPSLKKSTRAG